MAEAYQYSREGVQGANGENVGTALFRRVRGTRGRGGLNIGQGEWEFRGTRGRIQNYERSAAARGAARNSAYNRNYRVNRRRG